MWHHKQNYNLNQRVTGTIYAIIPTEYEKYSSILILEQVNVLDESIKLHGVHFFNMIPYKKSNVLKSTYAK